MAHFFSCTGAGPRRTPLPGGIPLGRHQHAGVANPAGLAVSLGTQAGGWFAPMHRSIGAGGKRSGARHCAVFGPISAAEVRHLMKTEWARTDRRHPVAADKLG